MTTLIAASDSETLTVMLLIVYFLPSVIAGYRHHHQLGAIVVINLLLGWTFIGWVVALAMAFSAVRRTA